ncbi:hypothetical protein BDV93DRAFT_520410 [Ceratobasidium sp. AG-I]|nr:hypothetical protein BDV93DRAFT_520410 [Ceratobasidium sp. AG-I]
MLLVEKKSTERQLWKFERLSEESGGIYRPQSLAPFYAQPFDTSNNLSANRIVSGDPDSPYVDDAHFHTDMLFNLPRIPFTRMQRAVVLEWARKMGTPNVPTLESLEECERRLEAGQARLSDENNSVHNMRRE